MKCGIKNCKNKKGLIRVVHTGISDDEEYYCDKHVNVMLNKPGVFLDDF